MQVVTPLFHVLVFPGFLFLVAFGLFASWVDRKLIAKFQNRVGPPIMQPFADLIKLLAKEDIIPEHADRAMFAAVPLIALAGASLLPVLSGEQRTQAPHAARLRALSRRLVLGQPLRHHRRHAGAVATLRLRGAVLPRLPGARRRRRKLVYQ